MIIDSHCHFDIMPSPEEYISNYEQNGNIIIGMTNLPSHFRIGIEHVQKYKHVRLALGLHPQLITDSEKELSLFCKLVDSTSYIGEIGLDFSREYSSSKELQIKYLRQILNVLSTKNKIISVHSRKSETELFQLLQEYKTKNVIFHWYSGSLSLIPQIIEAGYYFSINEAMTTSESGRRIIARIPSERILTESDAPFNKKSSIQNTLNNLGLSETQIMNNFYELINRIK